MSNAMLIIQRIEGNNVQTVYYGPEFGAQVQNTGSSKQSEAMKRAWATRRAKMAAQATPAKTVKTAKK